MQSLVFEGNPWGSLDENWKENHFVFSFGQLLVTLTAKKWFDKQNH
jgi:hypothetical protein